MGRYVPWKFMRFVGTDQPEDAGQLTSIVDYFDPLQRARPDDYKYAGNGPGP